MSMTPVPRREMHSSLLYVVCSYFATQYAMYGQIGKTHVPFEQFTAKKLGAT